MAARQRRGDDEGHFRLDLGLVATREIDLLAIGDFHVGEQHAEIRLVDADLALHRFRRQADLAAGQDAFLAAEPAPGV